MPKTKIRCVNEHCRAVIEDKVWENGPVYVYDVDGRLKHAYCHRCAKYHVVDTGEYEEKIDWMGNTYFVKSGVPWAYRKQYRRDGVNGKTRDKRESGGSVVGRAVSQDVCE